MKNRSPLAVFFLSIITFGIYAIVWQVKTKNEMNSRGADIPTAWLLIVPFVNYYWIWKYSEGVEKTTNGELSAVMAFVLLFLLGIVGMAILQNEFNKFAGQPAGAGAPIGGPVAVGGDPSAFTPPNPTPFTAGPDPALPPQPAVNPQPPIGGPQPPVVGGPTIGSESGPGGPDPDQPTPPLPPSQNPPLV